MSDVRRTRAYQRAVVREAEAALGDRIAAGFAPWFGSRIATFYRAEIDRQPAVLKVVTGKDAATSDIQFDALNHLAAAAQTGPFRVPRPILALPGRAVMIMGNAEGSLLQSRIPHLSRSDSGIVQLHEAATRCGQALAHIHGCWACPAGRFGSALTDDILEASPWRSTHRDQRLLRAAAATADVAAARSSRLYADFDPCNVFVSESGITLLDPPDVHALGPVHWDVATFRVGLERSIWCTADRYRQRAVVTALQQTFTNSYAAASGVHFGQVDAVLTLLCEIARLAQLLAWWSHLTRHEAVKGVARLGYARPMVWLALQSRRRALEQLLG